MDAVRTSKTSVYYNQSTQRYIPEGCHLNTHRSEPEMSQEIDNFQNNNHVFVSVILLAVLYGSETWTLTLREAHRMRVSA
jgi:hypothetical protein